MKTKIIHHINRHLPMKLLKLKLFFLGLLLKNRLTL